MRKIPLKNYIILFLICVITFLLTIYLRNLYLDKKEYENNSNSRMGFLQTIREEELNTFITENRDFILYISNADDDSLEEYEISLKEKIVDNDYTKEIIYLSTETVNSEILNKYVDGKFEVEMLPIILAISDGKIIDVMYPEKTDYNVQKTIEFIGNNYLGE